MNRSKIEWCDYTINPVKGLCPMACSYCYARRMYKRFKWEPEIRFDIKPMISVGLIDKPSRIFVGSTFELFGDWVSDAWLNTIFRAIEGYTQHTFIFLTKQPQNLIKWSPFPDNCDVGVSVCNQEMFIDATMDLTKVIASVKFISFEPLLEQIDGGECEGERLDALKEAGIDWVIIGQQTPVKKATMPKIGWVEEIVNACDKAHIPVFLKDNLIPMIDELPDNCFTKNEWGEQNLRQEFPKLSKMGVK